MLLTMAMATAPPELLLLPDRINPRGLARGSCVRNSMHGSSAGIPHIRYLEHLEVR